MNKQELASKIWSGANELRGKVSASSYKIICWDLFFINICRTKKKII